MTDLPHLIGGHRTQSRSGRTFVATNPATGSEICRVAFAEADDVNDAVVAAKGAYRAGDWSRADPAVRGGTLRELAIRIRSAQEEIAQAETQNSGKPIVHARTEVALAAELVDYYAGVLSMPDGRTYPTGTGHLARSVREPYGVVGAIAPWNYPFLHAAWKTIPALAAGNSVVLKMAGLTPITAFSFALLAESAGLPAGVLNVVHGDGPTTGAALVSHPDVAKVTFTGSTAVGREILREAANQIKSVHLELGGKTANIVFDDADLEQAALGSVFTAFYNSGQICTSGSRLLVHERVADRFVDTVVDLARSLRVGPPGESVTQVGPVVSEQHLQRVLSYIDIGRTEGAQLATGGRRVDKDLSAGYYVEPTIFVDVDASMQIAKEEIFGPVLSVMRFSSEQEAISIANGVEYGLAASVWTTDLGRAFRTARDLEAGIIWTNCPHYLPFNVPYEGQKMSGLGEDLGIEALHTFTRLKTHCLRFDGSRENWATASN